MAIRTSWPLAAAGLAIALSAQPAGANGRFPATVSVQHVPGDNNSIFLPSTFGLLYSTDDGASFHWVCEQAIGYTGVYDPDYALESDGTIWATTFDGLRVTRDGGCNWTTIGGPLDGKFIGEVEVGPNGTVWATTSTGGEQNDVYKSTNGTDFTGTGLTDGAAWWRTLRVAPTNADRIYVTGFRPSDPTGDAMTEPEALAYRSDNGGTSWTPLDLSQITFGTVPQLDLVAVAPDDPDTVWAVAVTANEPIGDSLYVSTDAGANWNKILDVNDIILAFLVVENAGEYEIRVGTLNDGNRTSLDSGDNWTRTETPRMACISRRGDGTYFSCGANWDPDFFALGRSTDAQSWEKVVRFAEIAGPVSCDPGTVQFDVCESQVWPDLVEMFGIGQPDAGPGGDNDGGDSDAGMDKPPKDGCFDCSGGGSAGGLLIALAALAAIRRRRLA
jgi:hypothetical protein